MQLLATEEYGLRCLLQVAAQQNDAPVTTQQVAHAEGIGPEYAARLLRELRAGGLLESTRGASGGYRLTRPAAEISVWDAMLALGGEFFPEEFCVCHPGRRRECVHSTDCSIRAVWRRLQAVLTETLAGISIAELIVRNEPSMVIWLDEHLASGTVQ